MQGLALSLQQKQKTTQFQKLATTLLTLQGQDLDEYIRQQSDENPLIEVAYPSRRPDADLPIAKLSETPQEKLKKHVVQKKRERLRRQESKRPVKQRKLVLQQRLNELKKRVRLKKLE